MNAISNLNLYPKCVLKSRLCLAINIIAKMDGWIILQHVVEKELHLELT